LLSVNTSFAFGTTSNNGWASPTYNQTNGVASLLNFGGVAWRVLTCQTVKPLRLSPSLSLGKFRMSVTQGSSKASTCHI
jgi:hypothetical protein